MSHEQHVRPKKLPETPVPSPPDVDGVESGDASVTLSKYRSGLSEHRTGLSEHRTQLSEYRTDLSGDRTEMSMRRTGMSFQRTRMSADRTLMSVIRTALSLIGFGFTIYQFFQKMHEARILEAANSPRNLGIAMVALGIGMLTVGIIYHLQYMRVLRRIRDEMREAGLIHGESPYPPSLTLMTAVLLLAIGIAAIVNMVF